MKVLDLINTAASAKELLFERALYLQRNFDVKNHILCSPGRYVEAMRQRGICVHVIHTPRTLRPVWLTGNYLSLVRLIRKEQYDIVHSHGSILGLLARLARPFTDAVIVHTVHGFHFHAGMAAPSRLCYEWAERGMLELTDLTLSQNQQDLELMNSWGSSARLSYIGNGIPLPERNGEYSARDEGEYLLVCVARFERVKNHSMLLRAFQRVRKLGVSVRLVCLGDGELLPQMKELASELGLTDDVEFKGYVDDVIPYLQEADLNLLTSVKEGLPRALIEGMALGIPCVATDVKGTREVVADHTTGRLVELGDSDAFADVIVELLRDPEERQRMSRAARRRAEELYDERDVCDRLYELYAGLVRERPLPRPHKTEQPACGKYSCSS